MVGILGKKLGMTQIFSEDGLAIPVTIVEAGPCKVVQVKTLENDGYSAVQLGFEKKPERLVNKPMMGHFRKHKVEPFRFLREFRDFPEEYCEVGKEVTVEVFEEGNIVKVIGISKGKGFQGVVKRHGFGGGPRTHGQSDRLRAPGSIGASAFPSRVIKGLRMAGRMGGKQVTVKGLTIVKIDKENNLLFIKGAVPGARNSLLIIRRQES
ncbi:MAG: 50S ribosomal protein L3 [Candidatus Neomarinimicrobiota bacterium]|nr:50S ribosomal protein L3 [Candidatus Neomarinimicrobiota bacterium]RKY45388.1 MAG: 50S ribosomal protein L3 [Candidatus Neomarinimicrobiota bacterium]RKY54564.1 MAG: 50S ribosomal protein L3 [Candidatus Neomarinimicrobiota bacterium]